MAIYYATIHKLQLSLFFPIQAKIVRVRPTLYVNLFLLVRVAK